jgi:hypothetical protein
VRNQYFATLKTIETMLFIPLIIGFLFLVSYAQAMLQKPQNKIQTPHPYNYGAENPYFPQQLPQPFYNPTVFPQKAPTELEISQLKKRQEEQGIFYTALFVLGLLIYLIYN